MQLPTTALEKLGANSRLHTALAASRPDSPFTAAHRIMVTFDTPQLAISNGPGHEPEVTENEDEVSSFAQRGRRALQAIPGLTVDSYFENIATAMVSGPAKAIIAMLELPEVKGAALTGGITVKGATGRDL